MGSLRNSCLIVLGIVHPRRLRILRHSSIGTRTYIFRLDATEAIELI